MSKAAFRVALTGDFLTSAGAPNFEVSARAMLESAPGVVVEFLKRPPAAPVTHDDLVRYDALLIKRNPVDASVLAAAAASEPGMRLRLLARSGAGFEHIDVDACTRGGVMVVTTPSATARPVASAVMAMMLAFAHRLPERDRMTRAGRWSERVNRAGIGLTGKTLGVVGLGNIGRELLRLAAPWQMRHLACTPRPREEDRLSLGVEFVPMDGLLAQSHFVALCCPLDDRTQGMIDRHALARMRSDAWLINVARGEIVDEAALVAALRQGRIAGAGIDVYQTEPPAPDHPLFSLDNVIVTSHNVAITDELNTAANRGIAAAALAVAANRVPEGLINPGALAHRRLARLAR
jgi:D-3-phosphoglycerate dehydrogenase